MNTWHPTQLGYIPTGVFGTVSTSTLFAGRTITGSFEGPGFGANGRPDYLQVFEIALTSRAGDGTLTQRGTITINVSDLVSIAGLPSNLNLTLREVDVCESSVAKKAVVLMSQTYT